MRAPYYVVLVILLASLGHSIEWFQENNPHFLNGDEIDKAISDPESIKIVKFFSPACRYCRFVKNYIDEYKTNNAVDPHLKFFEINCPLNIMQCIQKFQIRSYPAIIVFNEMGSILQRIDGLYPREVFHQMISSKNTLALKLGRLLEETKQPRPQEPAKNDQQPPSIEQKQPETEASPKDPNPQMLNPTVIEPTPIDQNPQKKQIPEPTPTTTTSTNSQNVESAGAKTAEVKEKPIIVEQVSLENRKAEQGEQMIEEAEKDTVSDGYLKYLIYLGAIGAASYYAWSIVKNREDPSRVKVATEVEYEQQQQQEQKRSANRSFQARDVEVEAEELVDSSIPDEEL